MSVWSRNRQFTVLFVFFFILVLGVSIIAYMLLDKPPSCVDKKQNQGELGVDCGGPCEKVCAIEATPLIPIWNRVFRVEKGSYDVAAYVENHNAVFGVSHLPYSVKIYDKDNVLIQEKTGETYANPKERFIIFESTLASGERIPARAVVEIPREPVWKRLPQYEAPIFLVKNKVVSLDDSPRVTATVVNASLFSVRGFEAVAIVYDEEGNAIAGSRTLVTDTLDRDATRDVTFTWPERFSAQNPYVEIYVRSNRLSE